MPKRLIVTVGTSLFYSASWKCAGKFADIDDYREWLDPARITNPGARRSWSGKVPGSYIENQIGQLLMADPEKPELVDQFDSLFAVSGRYSAEVSTLLAMRLKLDKNNPFEAFLQKYSPIVLLHGGGAGNPAAAAAQHMSAALRKHASANVEAKALDGYTIQDELRSIVEYLKGLDNEPTDLVATGGYKAFTVALGHIYWQRAHLGWRLFYLHDSDMGELIQEWGEGQEHRLQIADTRLTWGAPHI